jgi:hypothetical protein
MAYLPKALLPPARRYLDRQRMRAADLIVAKSVLSHEVSPAGALPVFFEKHLDPARAESEDLKEKIQQLDEIDLQGWLSRLLLQEYKLVGDQLYPRECDDTCSRDAEAFARWLSELAVRKPGSDTASLSYRGRYFRVAVIFVAIKDRLAEEGLRPYRRRAKRYLYQDRYDAVYVMARDSSIPAVEELADELEGDARVASVERYRYALGAGFKKRHDLDREEAIVVCLRRREAPGEGPPPPLDDEEDDLRDEVHEPDLTSDPESASETIASNSPPVVAAGVPLGLGGWDVASRLLGSGRPRAARREPTGSAKPASAEAV